MLRLSLNKGLMLAAVFGWMFVFVSCTDKPEPKGDDGEIVIDDDYYEFQDLDLSKYGIEGYISLPDETANIGASTKPEVQHIEDDIYWTIKVGPNFELLIEDYASMSDLVKEEKKLLNSKKFFKLKYLVDEPDLIVYERVLIASGSDKASPDVGVEHKSYHVFGQKKIGNVNYALESREEGFEKMIIELMAKSIKSLKPKS